MSENVHISNHVTEASTIADPPSPKLLISVRSAAEALMARAAGIDWIDLKSPEMGPLGAPSRQTAEHVFETLEGFSNRSVALGELHQLTPSVAADIAMFFPIAKVGLSRFGDNKGLVPRFVDLARSLAPCKLIPVLYADGASCDAPSAETVIALAAETAAPFLLIDTFYKDGRGLLDWMSLAEIAETIATIAEFGGQTVLAGSLRLADVPILMQLSPAALAFRGAACDGARTDNLSADRMNELRQLLNAPKRR